MKLIVIQNKIYEIRDQKVMFDFDLADLYEVETRALKQAVKRNMESFPKDFMFQLTKKEWTELLAVDNNLPENLKFSPALPFAFTEHGVTMLASILKSKKARKMNIAIVRAFIGMKKFALHYKELANQVVEIRQRIGEHDVQLNQIYDAIENLLDETTGKKKWEERERIGFKK